MLFVILELARRLLREPSQSPPTGRGLSRSQKASFVTFLGILLAGAWSAWRLGARPVWILTGRGPGGRLLATQPTWPPRTLHLIDLEVHLPTKALNTAATSSRHHS